MNNYLTFTSIWIVILLCIAVLCGWHFDIVFLRSLLPNAPQTTPPTVIILLLLAVALFISRIVITEKVSHKNAWLCWIASILGISIGIWSGIQYIFDLGPNLELLIYPQRVAQQEGLYPGRPSPYTIISAICIGASIATSIFNGKIWRTTSLRIGLAGLIIPWLAIFGYASTTGPFYSLPYSPSTGMSPITAIGFIGLMIGVIGLRPDRGIFNLLSSNTSGGWVVKSLLPIAIGLPLVFGWIITFAQISNHIDTSIAFALSWGLSSLLFAAVVIAAGFILHNNEIEKKKTSEEREILLDELERSNRELQQFAYIASHDLQAPLRRISGFVQLLSQSYQGNLDEQANDWIKRIIDGTNQMKSVVHDILGYSRVESRELAFESIDLSAIFDEAKVLLSSSIEDSKANVSCDELPVVTGDRSQLLQLLQNLIGNAIKYNGNERRPIVHVSSHEDTDEWTVSVKDNGIGIGPEYHERIFEIFRRLHTQQEYPGTGIGLAICRRVVKRHGGRLWLTSTPDIGSTFYFSIPKSTKETHEL